MIDDQHHLHSVMRHIRHVQDNCQLLGERLIESGKTSFGLSLIANGQIHDHSKFFGIEWTDLRMDNPNKDGLKFAVRQHTSTNMHHPEYWGSINMMPTLYLAEAVCDWKARSSEFGSCLKDWYEGEARAKFGIVESSAVHTEILDFMAILLDRQFTRQ